MRTMNRDVIGVLLKAVMGNTAEYDKLIDQMFYDDHDNR